MIRGLTAVVLALLALAPPAARAQDDGGDQGGSAPAKPKLTAEEIEKRFETVEVAVDWKEMSVLDALNDLVQKGGLKISVDPVLGKYGGTRTVTLRDFRISVKEACRRMRPQGVEVEVDAAAGGLRAFMPPEFPTEVALREKKVKVKWAKTPVAKAISDLEKQAGVKIELAEKVKSKLSSKKVDWEAEDVPLSQAIAALYEGVQARATPRPDLKVLIEWAGPPETKAEVEKELDAREVALGAVSEPLPDVLDRIARLSGLTIECEAKLKKAAPKVTTKSGSVTVRAALDDLAKQAGATWKVEGTKVVVRAGAAGK